MNVISCTSYMHHLNTFVTLLVISCHEITKHVWFAALSRPLSRLAVNFMAGLAFSRLILSLSLAVIFTAAAAYHFCGLFLSLFAA